MNVKTALLNHFGLYKQYPFDSRTRPDLCIPEADPRRVDPVLATTLAQFLGLKDELAWIGTSMLWKEEQRDALQEMDQPDVQWTVFKTATLTFLQEDLAQLRAKRDELSGQLEDRRKALRRVIIEE